MMKNTVIAAAGLLLVYVFTMLMLSRHGVERSDIGVSIESGSGLHEKGEDISSSLGLENQITESSVSKTSSFDPSSELDRREVFRLRFEDGALSLIKRTEVSGNFRNPRDTPRYPGMLVLRLVDGSGSTVSELTTHDPTRACFVCDAHASGAVVPFRHNSPALIEVKFPIAATAKKLKVSRIIAGSSSSPNEAVIAEFPL